MEKQDVGVRRDVAGDVLFVFERKRLRRIAGE